MKLKAKASKDGVFKLVVRKRGAPAAQTQAIVFNQFFDPEEELEVDVMMGEIGDLIVE